MIVKYVGPEVQQYMGISLKDLLHRETNTGFIFRI